MTEVYFHKSDSVGRPSKTGGLVKALDRIANYTREPYEDEYDAIVTMKHIATNALANWRGEDYEGK